MKNKLSDLNNHLFAQLERLGEEGLTQEVLEKEVARADAIVSLSEQIISSANVALHAANLLAKHGSKNWEQILPGIDHKPVLPKVPDFSGENVKDV